MPPLRPPKISLITQASTTTSKSGRGSTITEANGFSKGNSALFAKISKNKKWLLFASIYFFGWAAYAAGALDFVFFSSRVGFNNSEIGIFYAVCGLIGIIFQPVFGLICDYIKSTRPILLISLIFAVALSIALRLSADNKALVISVCMAYSLFMSSFMPLLDNWIARECVSRDGYNYGALRLWGSIGFAVVALVYGQMALTRDISFIYIGRAFFLVITFALIFINRYESAGYQPKSLSAKQKNRVSSEKPNIRALFKNREYVIFIIFAFIFCFPLNAAGTFFPSLLLAHGGTNATIGLFSCLNALIEIPFFLYTKKLTGKIGARGLIFIGGLFIAFRMAGFALAINLPMLFVTYLFIVPYTCFFMPGFIFYIYSIAPKNTEAFAQTFIQAFAMGIAGMLGNYIGGIVLDNYGLQIMYTCAAVISFAGMTFFGVSAYAPKFLKSKKE